MTRVRVVIATTSGPVEIRRITPEHSDVNSAVCIEGTDSELPISAAYNGFVRPPTGIIQRYFEHDSYLLELSDRIDVGDSWKLGTFVAHALDYAGRLANGRDRADLVVWVTGEVQRDLGVPATGYVEEKLRRSQALFAELARQGTPCRLYMPEANAAELDAARFGEIGVAPEAVVAVSHAGDVLAALGLPAPNAKRAAPRRGYRPSLGLAASAAAVVIAAVVAVVLWREQGDGSRLDRTFERIAGADSSAPDASPGFGPTDPMASPFKSNLSTETISSLLSSRSIEGTSVVTGTTFVMNLTDDGKATVELKLPNTSAVMRDQGTWWVEDRKFCYKFTRFGKGRWRCRHVFEDDGAIKFMFLSGLVVDWRITPQASTDRSASPSPPPEPR